MRGESREFEFDAKLADSTIRYCVKCKKCWEIIIHPTQRIGQNKNIKNVHYYSNFPSYGKQKIECLHCSNIEYEDFVQTFYTRRVKENSTHKQKEKNNV